jgi:hypothetical protein
MVLDRVILYYKKNCKTVLIKLKFTDHTLNHNFFIFLILLLMTQTLPQSKTNLFHEFEEQGFYLAQFKTPELAIFSYYL